MTQNADYKGTAGNSTTHYNNRYNVENTTYNALGEKLIMERPGMPRPEYTGRSEITGTNFESVAVAEGRAVLEPGQCKYDCVIRNHPGNTRAVVRRASGGNVGVRSVRAYYLIRMEMAMLHEDFGQNLRSYSI